MTDTTDIAALRELLSHENRESDHHVGVTVTTLRLLLSKADQLEAERQRAAGSEEELHKALHREKTAERKLLAAQGEIAKLKGGQVPVVLVDERQGSGGFCLTQHGRRLNLPHGTELFTSPQKPVVSDNMALAFHNAHTDGAAGADDIEEIKVGLRAALGVYDGGIVKDGE